MNPKTVLKKNPEIVTREIDEETILMPIYKSTEEMNYIYTLNPVATFVWKLIDEKNTVEEIEETIRENYSSPEDEIKKELSTLLEDLNEINAVFSK